MARTDYKEGGRNPRVETPEQRLVAAVLELSARDLEAPRPVADPSRPDQGKYIRGVREARRAWRRNRREALQFFFGPPSQSNFQWMAEGLGLQPQAVREALVRRFEGLWSRGYLRRLLREALRQGGQT